MLLRALLGAVFLIPAFAAVDFDRDVRPILSNRCFACHGPDANRKSTLRLDTEEGAKANLGTAAKPRHGVVPRNPEASAILQRATTSNAGLRMPPAWAGRDPLTQKELAVLREWVADGAPWGRHWAFVPPRKAPLPAVREGRWIRNPLDRFVLARLEKAGLKPSMEASPRTLIRRLALDLTGLPPDPAEVEAFAANPDDAAYARAVDRFLASPRYAERMAIRWLEAGRYGDTNGYQSDGVRSMWRWRDWVIDAFARNMPFDRFTVEQLAGDLLPNPTLEQRMATAFHRNHRTTAEGGIVDEEWRVEYVADRAETTATVWMGLTMGCARCHDHKFDPLTQRDFYSLFAFFNNVPEKGFVYNFGNEPPYITAPTPEQAQVLAGFDARLAQARQDWDGGAAERAKAQQKWEKQLRKGAAQDWKPADKLAFEKRFEQTAFRGGRVESFGTDTAKFNHRDPFTIAAWVKPETENGAIVTRYDDYFEGSGYGIFVIGGKLRFHYIFRSTDLGMRLETKAKLKQGEWQHVAVTFDGSMKASNVRVYLDGRAVETDILFDQSLWPLDHKAPLRVGAGAGLGFDGEVDDVRIYSRVLTPAEASTLPLRETLNQIARVDAARRTAAQVAKLDLAFLDRHLPARQAALQRSMLDAEAARADYFLKIPTLMVMEEGPVRQAHLLKRGAYDAPGEKVDAAVPEAIGGWNPEWPRNRLGLGKWLVSRDHPLTARVAVNRFWQSLFGVGLVKTVEDFGAQGERPVQQDLLDWLAVDFVESGWDVKRLLKLIVTSSMYRQSSAATPALLERDPENRLMARGARYRLPAEMIRDQALAVSGLLVEDVGGPSVRPYQPPGLWKELASGSEYEADSGPGLYRRSLYSYWRRTIAPPGMVTFDSPNREVCVVRETRTNTPLQALNLMNDVTFVEAARMLAGRMIEAGPDDASRIRRGVELVLAREPKDAELASFVRLRQKLQDRFSADPAGAAAYLKVGEAKGRPAVPEAELAAYTGLASVLLNLDETVTRE